jgi:hypothetical protein
VNARAQPLALREELESLVSVTSGTLRPKAQLPPHQTALVEPVHSQNGGRGHFVLSWAVPTRRTIDPIGLLGHRHHFLANLAGRHLLLREQLSQNRLAMVAVYLRLDTLVNLSEAAKRILCLVDNTPAQTAFFIGTIWLRRRIAPNHGGTPWSLPASVSLVRVAAARWILRSQLKP